MSSTLTISRFDFNSNQQQFTNHSVDNISISSLEDSPFKVTQPGIPQNTAISQAQSPQNLTRSKSSVKIISTSQTTQPSIFKQKESQKASSNSKKPRSSSKKRKVPKTVKIVQPDNFPIQNDLQQKMEDNALYISTLKLNKYKQKLRSLKDKYKILHQNYGLLQLQNDKLKMHIQEQKSIAKEAMGKVFQIHDNSVEEKEILRGQWMNYRDQCVEEEKNKWANHVQVQDQITQNLEDMIERLEQEKRNLQEQLDYALKSPQTIESKMNSIHSTAKKYNIQERDSNRQDDIIVLKDQLNKMRKENIQKEISLNKSQILNKSLMNMSQTVNIKPQLLKSLRNFKNENLRLKAKLKISNSQLALDQSRLLKSKDSSMFRQSSNEGHTIYRSSPRYESVYGYKKQQKNIHTPYKLLKQFLN